MAFLSINQRETNPLIILSLPEAVSSSHETESLLLHCLLKKNAVAADTGTLCQIQGANPK